MSENKAGTPERIYAEPRPHLVIHGANLETMARYAYNEMRHDKCVPYYSESALAEAKATARAEAFEEAISYLKSEYEGCQEGTLVSYHIASEILRVWVEARASGASKGGE